MIKILWSSHFSGAGGSTLGAIAAAAATNLHILPISAIDNDSAIARLYTQNIGAIKEDSVVDFDWRSLDIPPPSDGRILVHQTSPPCQDDSLLSNLNSCQSRGFLLGETFEFYRLFLPEIVILENVPNYIKNPAYLKFISLLKCLGYVIKETILDAYDCGVPQQRKRLITVGDRLGLDFAPEQIQKRTGWFEIASPHLNSCQPGKLTKNQLKTLKPNQNLIIERIGYFNQPKFRLEYQPIWTVRAGLADDGKGGTRTKIMNICLEDGRCLTVNEKVLGALQTFPASYRYSNDFGVNVRAIGNSVPPAMMQNILQPIFKALSLGDAFSTRGFANGGRSHR